MNKKLEMDAIFSCLEQCLPKYWDGQEAILYMKDNGCRNWRQMEWPGWYFQFICELHLPQIGFQIPGPQYGNVEFDGFNNIPWDFKAHTSNGSSGSNVPTNGYREVSCAVKDYGTVGFIIANGTADFDDEYQTFKKWHDRLKGKTSAYELDRIARGASSRRRKKGFVLNSIDFVFIDSNSIDYCGLFQGGMRNSNGTSRSPKVMLDLRNPHLDKYHYPF